MIYENRLYFVFLIKLFLFVKVYVLNRLKTNYMKIALLSAFSILILSGCTKTYNYPTVNQVFSAVYTVQPNQWAQATDQGSGKTYYYTTLSVPELTQAIDLNGGVITYLSFDS